MFLCDYRCNYFVCSLHCNHFYLKLLFSQTKNLGHLMFDITTGDGVCLNENFNE